MDDLSNPLAAGYQLRLLQFLFLLLVRQLVDLLYDFLLELVLFLPILLQGLVDLLVGGL